MRWLRASLFVLLAVALLLAIRPAHAWVANPSGCRFAGTDPPIGYYLSGVTSAYATATTTSEGYWDATSSPGYFHSTGSLYAQVHVYDGYYGANGYVAWISGGCGGDIYWDTPLGFYWNQSYLDGSSAARKAAVGSHEFGHVYGLWETGHFDCHNQSSHSGIMTGGTWAYDNCGWNSPKVDDVAGVNAIY